MSRRRDVVIPPICLDRESPAPLRRQLRGQIAAAIQKGTFTGGRLPSTRLLARSLGVSRNTVLAAYDELVADGYLEGRAGTGMVLTSSPRTPPALDPARLLREAQYPARVATCADQDGTPIYISY